MTKPRIIILGAGFAGLSAAFHLGNLDIDCQVFEKEASVGGLCRSKHINGFTFDFVGHLFYFKNNYTFNLLKSLMDGNLIPHQRDSWIYSFNTYTPYPFQANLFGLPSRIKKECLLGLIKAKSANWFSHRFKNFNYDVTFADWIFYNFGSGIAKHFMSPYNTKFWTLPPSELTCAWIDGHIYIPTLAQAIKGTLTENRRRFGYNSCFWYPLKGGIAEIPLALSKQVKKINTSCEAVKIDILKKEIEFKNGRKENFDKLISTIPLPEIRQLIGNLPESIISAFEGLRYISIFNLNLGVERSDLSNRHWIYFPESDYIFYRVGFPHNFSAHLVPAGKSSLYAEVSYSKTKPLAKRDIVQEIIQGLKKAKILSKDDKLMVEDINDIKYGYILYDNEHQKCTRVILDFLAKNQIYSIGRYGSWRYMSMEDVILEGKRVAESVAYIQTN